MPTNLDRYKRDLDSLLTKGNNLLIAMKEECFPGQIASTLKDNKEAADKVTLTDVLEALPSFKEDYQSWYSETKVLIKQLLPDRLSDFVHYYEKPKPRKDITYESYRIEDYLQGLNVTRQVSLLDGEKKIVGPDAAIPQFLQQVAILKSVKARFERLSV